MLTHATLQRYTPYFLTTNPKPDPECHILAELLKGKSENEALAKAQQDAKLNIKARKKEIDMFNGVMVPTSTKPVSGSLIMLRNSLDSIREHAFENVDIQKWLSNIKVDTPLEIKYIGWSEVRFRTDKEGNPIRKHSEAELFTYYELKIENKAYYLNAKAHRRYNLCEVIYTIETNSPKNLKKGIPEIYKKMKGCN